MLIVSGLLTWLLFNTPITSLLVSAYSADSSHSDDTLTSPVDPAQAILPWSANPLHNLLHAYTQPIASIFTPEVQHWGIHLSRWAAEFGLDPNLAATVMQIESCGNPWAVSSAGAMGLFQVMPFHFSRTDFPFDPEVNARRGLAYLAQAMERARGDVAHALAGYNGGLSVIHRPSAWSAQTQRYVYYGTRIYADASGNLETSPALQEWYRKYGRSLCQQASRVIGKR